MDCNPEFVSLVVSTDKHYKGQEMGPFIFLENFEK